MYPEKRHQCSKDGEHESLVQTESLHTTCEAAQPIRVLRKPLPEVPNVSVAHRMETSNDRCSLDVVQLNLSWICHLRDKGSTPNECSIRRGVRPSVRRSARGVEECPAKRSKYVGRLLDPPFRQFQRELAGKMGRAYQCSVLNKRRDRPSFWGSTCFPFGRRATISLT